LSFTSIFEIFFELADTLLEEFSISLELLNLKCVTLNRFLGSSILLKDKERRRQPISEWSEPGD